MEDLAFDWLYQLERGQWERRIRELKQELGTQQLLAAKQKLVAAAAVEVVVVVPQPVAAKPMQPQQLQLELEDAASPPPLQTRQKLMRLVNYK